MKTEKFVITFWAQMLVHVSHLKVILTDVCVCIVCKVYVYPSVVCHLLNVFFCKSEIMISL